MYMLSRFGYETDDHKNQYSEEEVAYWRKHPDLHRFFEDEWRKLPGNENKSDMDFNCQFLEMNEEIIEKALFRVTMRALPNNDGGFFFGESTYTKEDIRMDLQQLSRVKELLKNNVKVYYYSSF